MKEEGADSKLIVFIIIFIFSISDVVVEGDSMEKDKEVLLDLKVFLENQNRVNRGRYASWNNETSSSPCQWQGIICNSNDSRVTGIDLSGSSISGEMFRNFSDLTELSYLDLSENTISGQISENLNACEGLKFLNLSRNIMESNLNLSGLINMEVLDLSVNRFSGEIQSSFPAICNRLIVANISGNNLTGRIDNCFDECSNLQYLDLSSNHFNGVLWLGFEKLLEFSVSENELAGSLSPLFFTNNCSLKFLDLSGNNFTGEVPGEISNCAGLVNLILSGNKFSGKIPHQVGDIQSLEGLHLGTNNFSREIPSSLTNLTRLVFLDMSKNNFGGEIQEILGKVTQVQFLLLHGNSYTGGINSSGIVNLPNISRLDLSYNSFSGPLPEEISGIQSLQYLMLAYNQFSGPIPSKFGNLANLQALDISYNMLNGSVPRSFGNLKFLLWLMVANNSLTGQIPEELGNCSSLLWLNLANNKLSGKIPSELTSIGKNASVTFEVNRKNEKFVAGSGECLTMKRWIPADYPPFNSVYAILTRKSCRSIWDRLLKGYGLFPICSPGSSVRTLQISGYVQLSGNQLSGELTSEISKMGNFTMLHLSNNNLNGKFPSEIGNLPLVVLNISNNNFSGEFPSEIGNIKCLQNLDLSYNNFSGIFPNSLSNLSDLSKFNVSYNPLISGKVPTTGQFITFEKESYLGDPLLLLPDFFNTNPPKAPSNSKSDVPLKVSSRNNGAFVSLALVVGFLICVLISVTVCLLMKKTDKGKPSQYLLEDAMHSTSSSRNSSPWLSDSVKVIRLDRTAFTHADILKATGNFSEDRVIGKGGFGTVYRGVLPDGRQVAVKKLQREGIEGEKEFQAEMEVLTGNNSFSWPHPNLVALYGWCLDKSEKILVYEYMEGGSLEDLILDRLKFSWRSRIKIAIHIARALVYLHHECFPAIVHRDVKASNVLLDKDGNACVTDFGLARVVDIGDSHVSTMVAGTVGYVAPEYGQTWKATTKGDVYSFGVLAMELATGRRAVDGGEECLVEWAKRVMKNGRAGFSGAVYIPAVLFWYGLNEGAKEMFELLRIGVKCTNEIPQCRPNMKEVLDLLVKVGEVGELSEIFQWRGEVERGLPNWSEDDKEHLEEELSDVLLYLIQLADVCGLDLGQAALSKIIKNARKYPIHQCKPSGPSSSSYN